MTTPVSLSKLLENLSVDRPIPDVQVSGLVTDSREIQPGDLFVALKGEHFDARQLIDEAYSTGAPAILIDANDLHGVDECLLAHEWVLPVKNLPQVLSLIGGRFYRNPSHHLTLVGVTGTNGKTTICYYLAQMLRQFGHSSALIGTLGAGRIEALKSTGMTTPDALGIQKHLAHMLADGVEVVCMEVSSHALELGRVAELQFDYMVFSNISQDHLDFHVSMAAYRQAKTRLFKEYEYKTAIINADDELGRELISLCGERSLSYGVEAGALHAQAVELDALGLKMLLGYSGDAVDLSTTLIGAFNAYNLLAVVGVGLAMNLDLRDITAVLQSCRPAPGRMQRVEKDEGQPVVVVDFAHTPDALDKALQACQSHCAGELSVVFGCGGDRDKAKRAQMGRIAEARAQRVWISDDNPRTENPGNIVSDILLGMSGSSWVMHDRCEAIRAAITTAGRHDWVLIAGKGHETQQVYADRVIELNDYKIAAECLQELAA